MNRVIQFALFFTIFISILFLMNYYVFVRFAGFFEIKRNWIFYSVMILAILSYFLASFIERFVWNIFSRSFYTIASVWIGVLFISFCSLLVFELLNLFIALPKQKVGIFLLVFIAILTIVSLIAANFIYVKKIEVHFPTNMRVVQLSDIHVGTIRNSGFMESVVEKTNKLNPEVVFITGDLVDGSGPLTPHMYESLNNIKAPVYYVIGNHETYEGTDKVVDLLKDTKVIVLRNEVKTFGDVQIIGVDYSDRSGYLNETLKIIDINNEKPSILLYHTPSESDVAKDKGINLMLSGHTHNGQIYPFNLFVLLQFKKIKGLYELNENSYLYVSQGTGTWGPPMRLGSYNEITYIELKEKS